MLHFTYYYYSCFNNINNLVELLVEKICDFGPEARSEHFRGCFWPGLLSHVSLLLCFSGPWTVGKTAPGPAQGLT